MTLAFVITWIASFLILLFCFAPFFIPPVLGFLVGLITLILYVVIGAIGGVLASLVLLPLVKLEKTCLDLLWGRAPIPGAAWAYMYATIAPLYK